MKAIFIFDDDDEHELYADAPEMYDALNDMFQYLRQQNKYAETPDSIDKIYERFNDILKDNELTIP